MFPVWNRRTFNPTFQEPVQFGDAFSYQSGAAALLRTLALVLACLCFSRIALSGFPQRSKKWLIGADWIPRTCQVCVAFPDMEGSFRLAQHHSQHMKEPCSSFVADRFVSVWKMRRYQPLPQRHRSRISQPLAIFVRAQKIRAGIFPGPAGIVQGCRAPASIGTHNSPDLPRSTGLGNSSTDQITPPLMRRLVDQYLVVQFTRHWIKAQVRLLLRTQKRIARQEDQPGPSLTQIPRICVNASEL